MYLVPSVCSRFYIIIGASYIIGPSKRRFIEVNCGSKVDSFLGALFQVAYTLKWCFKTNENQYRPRLKSHGSTYRFVLVIMLNEVVLETIIKV